MAAICRHPDSGGSPVLGSRSLGTAERNHIPLC
jgi:hypothetical protein